MKTHKCFRAAAVAAVLSLAFCSAFAEETMTTPKEWVHGFINGYFSIMVYPFGEGDAKDTKYPWELQMKGPDDSDYRTIFKGNSPGAQYTYDGGREPFLTTLSTGAGSGDQHRLDEYNLATNFYGTASFRIRSNVETNTSAWVELGESTAYLRLTGTWLKSSNVTEPWRGSDGVLQKMVQDSYDTWLGIDLGQTRKVRGIRYYSRSDGSYTRINNAYVEHADDASFTGAVRDFTITANASAATSTADRRNITFLRFDTPIETRCIRLVGKADQYFPLSEFEVVAAQLTAQPTVAADHSFDGAYGWPKLSWTVPAGTYPVSNRVLRATSETGDYAAVTDWTEGVGSAFVETDAALKPSVTYYYKVEVWCNHPALQDETDDKVIVSAPVSVTHIRRLDRDASTGALQTGVSYMTQTNGVASDRMWKAFDGDITTYPDAEALLYGPVGLKFATKTWVSTFGYVCRQAVTGKRITVTSLYSTDATDTALDNKVCRSAAVTSWDQTGTQYYQSANSIPDEGADQYFLFVNDPKPSYDSCFFGNVAELQFYGWNQDDIDNAGVLLPPSDVTLTRLPNGVRVAWGVSSAASGGYDVERRVHGTDEWTAVVSLSDRTATSYDDTGIASGNYDYRVVAKRGEDTAASAVVSTIYYVPGSGTGLKSTVFWPFKATDPTLCAPDKSYDRSNEAPNLAFAAEDEFAPDVLTNAVLAMKGTIIVPFTGTYTFRLDVADGGAVYVDDEWAANRWVSGSSSDAVALTAGEHAIEVHARLESAANHVKLYWSGPVEEELVPATQLKPSETAYAFDRGSGWSARFYGGYVRGEVYGNAGDAGVAIKAGTQHAANWRTDPRIVFLAHDCSSSFTLSARMDDTKTQRAGDFGLMVRAANGNFVKFAGRSMGNGRAVSVLTVLTNGVDTVRQFGSSTSFGENNYLYDMKMVYAKESGTFTCFMRVAGDAAFTELGSWTNDGSIPDKFEVGYFVGGYSTGSNYGYINFTKRVFREKKGLAIILR